MTKKLHIHFDPEGDYLEVRFGNQTRSYFEMIGQDAFVRHDESSGEIKGYAFFNIQKRKDKILRDLEVEIPIN